jgi:predicted O-linked N-acetylglucosamine transferase (SPINDLY family)
MTLIDALRAAEGEISARRYQQAEVILRQILAALPNQPQALHLLAKLAMIASRPEVAIQCLQQAAASSTDPALLRIFHVDLGNILLMLGRTLEAIAAYRSAMQADPNHAGVRTNLGVALYESGQAEQALVEFRRAVELDPSLPEGYNNLGGADRSLGRFGESIKAYRTACELRPNGAEAHANLASVLKEAGQVDEAIAEAKRSLSIDPSPFVVHSNLLIFLQYRPQATPQEIFEAHRRWNEVHAVPLRGVIRPHDNDRSPQRRLRIGYISPDLREHSISYFFQGLLECHDPAQVETFCYAGNLRRADPMSQRLSKLAHHWINITGLSDERVAEMIRADKIDILVDLSGHTSGPRLLVLARKPAPVQVSYLGYPNTTGMDAIDYALTDAHIDPPGESEPYNSETLIRLPDTFACYTPPADAPQVSPLPALSNGSVTFASLNILAKINAGVIDVWAKLLERVPGSRLLMATRGLQCPECQSPLREAFSARGVAPERLEFAGWLPTPQYLALHDRIDILLDPFPINGHTITCHAAWMGVPAVSLLGHTRAGRLGAGVLRNLGLAELLANNTDQYISIASSLATDLPRLASLRTGLRQRMSESPLMAPTRLARHVEAAYRTMWHNWVSNSPPAR